MWRTQYANRKCNEYEKIREHKMMLERLVTAKSVINIKEPNKPNFLVHKAKKEQIEMENKMKVNYENRVLLTKIIEIESKPSPYNPLILQPKKCPAFDKDKNSFHKKKEKFELDKENLVN